MTRIEDENYNDGYYHIGKDVEEYPDATVYIIISRRGPGKTYGALRYPYRKNFKTLYLKRTNDDVATICNYNGDLDFDPSPWAPLNRDFGLNVHPRMIQKGLGAFYNCKDDGTPSGSVVNYIASLNAIKTIKGMDLSEAEWIILDEFIPQPGEVVKRAEGEMLLSLFETVNRDRRKRGRPGLKLILMANAEEISTHITNALEVVDIIADMQANSINKKYIEERGIFIHLLGEEFALTDVEKGDMYKVMAGTAWAAKSYGGEFSGNDFSCVQRVKMKGMKCLYHLHYRRLNDAYIYTNVNNGLFYMTHIKGKALQEYNLDRENDQKRFFSEHCIDLRDQCINDNMLFEKYSYYDLIMNYTKIYNL